DRTRRDDAVVDGHFRIAGHSPDDFLPPLEIHRRDEERFLELLEPVDRKSATEEIVDDLSAVQAAGTAAAGQQIEPVEVQDVFLTDGEPDLLHFIQRHATGRQTGDIGPNAGADVFVGNEPPAIKDLEGADMRQAL